MTGAPGGRQCPPWQRGLGIALENIVKCPGIFQGDRISAMLSLDSASTSPGTRRPRQRDHPRRWPGAECRGPWPPGRTAPHMEREPVRVCCPPHHPALGLCDPHCPAPRTDRSDPMSPSPASPAMSCSRHPAHWPLLPGQCLSGRVSGHFSPSQNPPAPQVENKCRGRKGETGSLKEIEGDISDIPSPSPMPTNQCKQLPWARERQKPGAPESSEETSVRHVLFFS